MVYGKACHPPIEMKNKAYWALKFLNFDESLSGEKWKLQLLELEEIRLNAYDSSKIYKQKMKASSFFLENSIPSGLAFSQSKMWNPMEQLSWWIFHLLTQSVVG